MPNRVIIALAECMTRGAGSSSSKTDPMTLFGGVTCTGSKLRPFQRFPTCEKCEKLLRWYSWHPLEGILTQSWRHVGWQTYGTKNKFPAFGAAAGGAIWCTFHEGESPINKKRGMMGNGISQHKHTTGSSRHLPEATYYLLHCLSDNTFSLKEAGSFPELSLPEGPKHLGNYDI